jgi:soluble lytic murein transglycosylase-like protein
MVENYEIGIAGGGLLLLWIVRDRLKTWALVAGGVALAYGAVKVVSDASPAAAAVDPGPVKVGEIPAAYRPWVLKAGEMCVQVPASLLAAQIEQESGWHPKEVSPAGAVGIAQFMPGTWPSWGRDDDGTGWVSPENPNDSIMAMARYDCSMAKQLTGISGDPTANVLAAYNAGAGAVQQYGGVPPYSETQHYVLNIKALQKKYTATTSTAS